jgi:hypothetical protein
MITELADKNILIKLQARPELLTFLMKLNTTDAADFKTCLDWSPSLIGLLSNDSPGIFTFLNKLTRDELTSLEAVLTWPAPVLARLRDQPWQAGILHKMWDIAADRAQFFKIYLNMYDSPNAAQVNIADAFSQGQLDSKLWLIETVKTLNLGIGRAWTLCGWIGTLGYFMLIHKQALGLESVRSFDIDDRCENLAETLNRSDVRDGWKFKASTLDINHLQYDNFEYSTRKYDGTFAQISDTADTVINTSCDHMGMDDTWWQRITPGKLVILQNNDWHENDQHDNSMSSIDEFKDKYSMSELLYAGVLDCKLYDRFMLIGRK